MHITEKVILFIPGLSSSENCLPEYPERTGYSLTFLACQKIIKMKEKEDKAINWKLVYLLIVVFLILQIIVYFNLTIHFS